MITGSNTCEVLNASASTHQDLNEPEDFSDSCSSVDETNIEPADAEPAHIYDLSLEDETSTEPNIDNNSRGGGTT